MAKIRREPFLSFKHVLGFTPNRMELYQLAVRHSSMPLKTSDGQWVNNERLEFLGDAVLNAVVTDLLYHSYPDKKEGFLTNARSNIVKRDSLNKFCRKIGFDKLIVADKQTVDNRHTNIDGNALEALIGAIYLDVGYRKCVQFVTERLISPEWVQLLAEDDGNYKSRLLEWCQQRRCTLDFELLEERVDSKNLHVFVSQVLIDGKPTGRGVGASKKESHQQAAKKALLLMQKQRIAGGQSINI